MAFYNFQVGDTVTTIPFWGGRESTADLYLQGADEETYLSIFTKKLVGKVMLVGKDRCYVRFDVEDKSVRNGWWISNKVLLKDSSDHTNPFIKRIEQRHLLKKAAATK